MTTQLTKRLQLLASVVSILLLIGIAAAVWIYARVRASLPLVDGQASVPGLTTAVRVDRDALGVPTLKAASRADIARALGFLHAQDRFFQMDIWRRSAAGELSALFGQKTLSSDKRIRMHGFRRIAQASLANLSAERRAIIEAYTEGVNAGLTSLRQKPFEYLVIRAEPEPWKPEDTFLVCAAMVIDLQDINGRYENTMMTLRNELGLPGLAFFAPLQTPADAALDGTTAPLGAIPGPKVINLRGASSTRTAPATPVVSTHEQPDMSFPFPAADPETVPGSNAFALPGAHTASGAALVASDMHLNLRVPNVWYRASFEFPGHKITGVTLPGVPVMIAGSNGRVAWAFTNAYVDTGDIIVSDTNPVSSAMYRAPGHEGLLEIEKRKETIVIKGEDPETVEYEWTIWGPILHREAEEKFYTYLWTGHDPKALDLGLMDMEDAGDVTAAVRVAHRAGIPAQNIVIADAAGDTAWTVAGRIPKRSGYAGRWPVTFQFADRKWEGYVPPEEIPVVSTKATGSGAEQKLNDGRIWSANQRMIGGTALEVLGDGGYARPSRGRQIRDRLSTLERATPRDLLAIQLDDRALFLERWHKLLMDTLSPAAISQNEIRGRLRQFAEKWEGKASVDAVSYPIVRAFRIAVHTRVFSAIFSSCTKENPRFAWNQLPLEEPLWKLLEERPMHLLKSEYASWDALLVAAVDDVITDLNRGGVRLPQANWGHRNTAEIRHPFSYMMPWFIRPKLDMPPDRLPGDVDMPRVQTPTHGASNRFVVAPGHEDEGLMHMPGGQSGHPLSPFYRAGHAAWVRGEPTPFLPGKPQHTLTLLPR